MKIRRNQQLRLSTPVQVNGHIVRTVRRLHGGAVKVETVRASVLGGKVTRRWRDINELGINLSQLKKAVKTLQEASAF